MTKYKVGDKVKVRIDLMPYEVYGGLTFLNNHMSKCAGQICTIKEITINNRYRVNENLFVWSEEMLEPVAPTLDEIKNRKLTCVIHTPNREDAMCVASKIPSSKSYTTSNEWLGDWDNYEEYTCYNIIDGRIDAYGHKAYFEEVYEFSDLPEFVFDAEQAKECAENIMATAESISCINGISYENSINKLKACLNTFPNDGISAKNGGKKSMKFTFYFNVNEGTRIDKSCNGTIPTITTSVVLDKFGVPDFRKCYSLEGEATCDKADYDMRQGVLEALANAVFDGNFEKAYDKAVKANALCERHDRTCYYCGKVFDTAEERAEHEAWHVERRKARHERYLLRKRAKEIAFEEQAQKMAKEMMKEA